MSIDNQILENVNGVTDVLISFDVTGSMSPCIFAVRQKLRDLVEKLFESIPEIKIGLIAHGDYCDGENCIKILDLTSNLSDLISFINNTPNAGGGDLPECYELVLNKARYLSWREKGILIMIGDSNPHEINEKKDEYSVNVSNIINRYYPPVPSEYTQLNWRDELNSLMEKNIRVIPFQCLKGSYGGSDYFWEALSEICQTPLILLDNFEQSSITLSAAVCAANSNSEDDYERLTSVACNYTADECSVENVSKLKSYAGSFNKFGK